MLILNRIVRFMLYNNQSEPPYAKLQNIVDNRARNVLIKTKTIFTYHYVTINR